ncbi:MAG: hypothetical protein A3E01_09200 [Gammaproteobacteria bacterium RIFCSPHIGHO2_12_FULL_63_22]|nr:MAG: hypothetical protein A3E01_09200 [Gammaproteobacteria bacterium RIFCSPHIGHO2_12_FULL_63_22]
MGKIGRIALVVAAVAVNVIPGVGQAISGAIVGALGGTFAAYGIAVTALQAVSLLGFAVGLGMVGSLFAPSAPKPEPAERQVKTSTPLRNYIYGRRRSYGALVLFETATDGTAVDVIAFADGRVSAVHAIYLNDDLVTLTGSSVNALADGRYASSAVNVGYNLGLATETAFSAVISKLPGIWTSSHRGDGVMAGYMLKTPVKQKHFLDVYPQGDNITLSLVIDGMTLFDPRLTGQDWADDDTWTGSFDNPVLGLLHYLVTKRPVDYDTKILPVIDYWIAAANICDTARALKAGGAEKLYRGWIMYDSSAKPHEVISEFLKTCDGWMGETPEGYLIIYVGQLYTPTVTITSTEIIDYEVKNFVEDEDRLNEVIVSYISDQHDFNTVEATAWLDSADIAERGRKVSQPFAPQVPSHAQVQYLAKRMMARQNAQYSGTISTNYSGRSVIGQRYINLTVEEAGTIFYDGLAEILTIERNHQTSGVNFTWAAVSAALDDWNEVTEEGDPAPVGDGVAMAALSVPVVSSSSAQLDGGSARILITCSSPDRADLTWYLHWRLNGETVWNEQEYSDIAQGTSIDLVSDLVPVDQSVEVEVSYSTGSGQFSGWSATETISTSTAALAPSPNTAFTASGGSGSVSGSWSNSTSSNFGHSELWYGTTSVFGSASQLGSDYSGVAGATEAFSESLSADDYYLWSVAYNAADSAASTTGPIAVTVT